MVREHHFAHKPPVVCQYEKGETELYLRAKREIYEALRVLPNCTKCELERRLDGVRLDVSLYINNVPVAIELQRSNITIADIARRTTRYSQLGIYTLWVLPFIPPAEDVPYRPHDWEKYLHALYFGRNYFWEQGTTLRAIQFTPQRLWVESREWFDESGEEMSAGGHYRLAKSLKSIATTAYPLDIAQDFIPMTRGAFETKHYTLPDCRLWIDNQYWG